MSFDSLRAIYRMHTLYTVDGGESYSSTFSSRMHLTAASSKEVGVYHFVVNRSEVLLNDKPADKLMDRIMHEAGCSLYPLSLIVSARLAILDVANYEEVKARWENVAAAILKKYPSPQIERYVRLSQKNMATRQAFVRTLYKDTFFNVYFRDIYTLTEKDEGRLIRWQNFPERETDQSYLYEVKRVGDKEVRLAGEIMKIIPGHNGTYDTTYTSGDKGEIHQIDGKIETSWQNRNYVKQLSVKADFIHVDTPDTGNLILSEQG